MRLISILSLMVVLAVPSAAADAEKARSNQLDKLFGQLHSKDVGINFDKIVQDIWVEWAHNDSPTAEALLRQATAAMNAHEYDAAEKTLIQLLESYPDFAEGWNKRATLYYMQGRNADSLVDISHVLELEPRHFGALSGKAMILRAQGKSVEALKVLRETLAINPHMSAVEQAIKELLKTAPDI